MSLSGYARQQNYQPPDSSPRNEELVQKPEWNSILSRLQTLPIAWIQLSPSTCSTGSGGHEHLSRVFIALARNGSMSELCQPGDFPPDTPDCVLVQHVLQGNQEAFTYLVERYHRVLAGYISYWSPDPSLVPDIEQDTLLRLYLSLPKLRTDQPLRAWLLRVAYHACMSERRRRKPLLFSQIECTTAEDESSWLTTLLDPDLLPEEQLVQQERDHLIHKAIDALPHGQRAALRLKYLDHLSYRAIARQLGIPEGTAKTHVARAKPLLRQVLTSEPSRVHD